MRCPKKMRALLLVLLTACGLLLTAGPAQAVQASLRMDDQSTSKGEYFVGLVTVTDLDGAADDLRVRREANAVVIAGSPAPTAGPGCVAVAPDAVRCRTDSADSPIQTVHWDLGAGDDRLDSAALSGTIEGGAGDDRLVLSGESGVVWDGGQGADTVTVQDPGVYLTATYAERMGPVSASVDGLANDGEAGEGDNIGTPALLLGGAGPDTLTTAPTGSELGGGPGADHLLGGPAKDVLSGGDGADVLEGGDGDDALTGGAGADVMDGGAGDDGLQATDARGAPNAGDVLRGGPGQDRASLGADGFPTPIDLPLGALAPGARPPSVGSVQDVERVFVFGTQVRLRGTAVDERLDLEGQTGSVLDGGAGDDRLSTNDAIKRRRTIIGGPGKDEVLPGSASDVLQLRDGEIDHVTCSSRGLFTVPQVDRTDVLRGCGAPVTRITRRLVLRGGSFDVPLQCPAQTPGPCRGYLSAGVQSIAGHIERRRIAFRIPHGAIGRTTIHLGPKALSRVRRSLRRDKFDDGVSVSVSVVIVRDLPGQAAPVTSTDTLALKAPGRSR